MYSYFQLKFTLIISNLYVFYRSIAFFIFRVKYIYKLWFTFFLRRCSTYFYTLATDFSSCFEADAIFSAYLSIYVSINLSIRNY